MANRSSGRVWRNPVLLLATGFGAGLSPWAPGTFGSLVGIGVYLLWARTLPPAGYALMLALMLVAGIWLCARAERELGRHDAPAIVWDEIVGQLLALGAIPAGWVWIALGFVLFRLFDIWKPFPISWLNRRVPGGLGIMIDDVAAGLFALLLLKVLAWLAIPS